MFSLSSSSALSFATPVSRLHFIRVDAFEKGQRERKKDFDLRFSRTQNRAIRKTDTKLSSTLSFAIFLQAILMYLICQMKSPSRLSRFLSFIKLKLFYFLHKRTYFYHMGQHAFLRLLDAYSMDVFHI